MNKKRLGIITFHCAENYGAFLQVYAMQSILNINKTIDVEIVDYRPNWIIDSYKINIFEWFDRNKDFIYNLKNFLSYMLIIPYRIIRKNKFRKILKLLNLSHYRYYKKYDFDEKKSDYDYLILGSDQIWNPIITKGIDQIYFGQFSNTKDCKIIGYAASTGILSYSNEEKEYLKKYLAKVDSIALRESSSINVLKDIYDREYNNVLDPTFLLETSFWEQFSKPINIDKYILVYQLENNPYIMEDAYKIAKEKNLEIVSFGEPGIKNIYKDKKIHSISYSGPREFVGAIKNAEVILTNSYHATCFSIIFKNVFYTYSHSKTSSRMVDLSKLLSFEDRIVDYGKSIFNINKIELNDTCKEIYIKLDNEKKKSIDYIADSIRNN